MKANEIYNRIIANIKDSDDELTELDFQILLSIYEYRYIKLKEKISDGNTQIKNDIDNNNKNVLDGFRIVNGNESYNKQISSTSESMGFITYKAKKGSQGYLLKYDKTINNEIKDQMIIKGLQKEDSSVYNYLFTDFYTEILKMIQSKNGNESQAEDVFMVAFDVLLSKVNNPNFNFGNNILGYFYTICEKKWFDLYKSENKLFFQKTSYDKIDIDEYDSLNSTKKPKKEKRVNLATKVEIDKSKDKKGLCGQVNSDPYITKAVFEYLDNRNPDWANLIYLKYIYGFDYDEISQFSTYKNASSVKTQISKVRKELINYCQRIL